MLGFTGKGSKGDAGAKASVAPPKTQNEKGETKPEAPKKFVVPESKTKDPAWRAKVMGLAIEKLEGRGRVPLGGKDLEEIAVAVGVKDKGHVRTALRDMGLHPKTKPERLASITVGAIAEAKRKLVEFKKANK
jgi:hypothetical protein